MNILTTEGVSKAYGLRVLFSDVTISLDAGQKTGLIGLNGAGKTTLLKIIAGVAEADSGTIWRNPKARIHFLPQEPQFQPGQTVLESVLDGDLPVMDVIRRYEDAVARDDAAAVLKLTEEMDASQAWELEQQARVILQELGITDYRAKTDTLSGGQRKRLGLARALIVPCDLLILDEPTNHLDDQTIFWLEEYLHDSKSAILLSTHDRYFLDQVVQRIIEISAGKAEFYSGNYSFYLEEKQERFNHQLRQYEQEQAKLKQLGFTVERMKGWGINNRVLYRRAMSIQHRMERIEKTERPTKEKTLRARFGEKEFHGDEVLTVKNLSKQFGGWTLFSGVELTVRGGERIALLGDNGTGKTTFLRVLLGELPAEGKIKFGPSVKSGYLPQVIHFAHPERTLYDTMLYEKNCTPQTARDRLGAFLFSGEDVFKTVSTLSGGEQSRLRLCMLMDEKINLLVLDEPTNHLDVASREWIECALEDYEGTLIFVSHDRYFVDKFATRIWELSDGTIRDFPCGYAKYRAILEHEAAARQRPAQLKKEKQAKPVSGSKELEKLVRRLEREIAAKEDEAAQLEQALAGAASDYQELLRLTAEKERCEAELEDLMARWEEAAQALEQG